jgi:capsular exopolysaccharide synthesis family protein
LTKNVAIAAAAGLLVAVTAILIIEFFNDILIWRRDGAQYIFDMPVLGAVGKMDGDAKQLVAQDQLWSPEADALRNLRNAVFLTLSEGQDLSTLLVTSALPAEGKSFLSANLAATVAAPGASVGAIVAASGTTVIVVDADLRKPSLHEIFDMPNLLGLADVLAMPDMAMEQILKKAVRSTKIDGLSFLPAGRTPLDPGSLLNSPRFVKVLETLSQQADLVIIDSAPLLEAIETKAIANVVDGVVMVVSDGQSRARTVQKAVDYFRSRPKNNLLGLVFNRVKLARHYDYYAAYVSQERLQQSQKAEEKPAFLKRLLSFKQEQQGDPDILSLAEVANQLGVSQELAQRWCEDGRLPAMKAGRQWTVHLEDLNEFISTYQDKADKGAKQLSPVKDLHAQLNGQTNPDDVVEIETVEQKV